jgi:hypothetical protein
MTGRLSDEERFKMAICQSLTSYEFEKVNVFYRSNIELLSWK